MLECNGGKGQQSGDEYQSPGNNNMRSINGRQYNCNSMNSDHNYNLSNLSGHSNGLLSHSLVNNSNGFQPTGGIKNKHFKNSHSQLKAKTIFETQDDPESSNQKNNSKTTAINSRSSMSHFDDQDQLDSLKEGTSCSLNFQLNKPFSGFINSFSGICNNLGQSINGQKRILYENSINNFSSSLFMNNSNNNMSIVNNNNNMNTIHNNNQQSSSGNILPNLQINQTDFSSPTYTQGSFNPIKNQVNKNNINQSTGNTNNTQKWGENFSSKLSLNLPSNKLQQHPSLTNNQEDEDEDLFNKESLSVLWAKPSELLAQTKHNLMMGEQNLLIDGNLKQQLNRKLLGESTFHKRNNNNLLDAAFTPSTMSHLNSNINLNNTNNFLDDDDKGERSSRGLRNLSLKVKQIVVQRVETSYKEVADQLVDELRSQNQGQLKQEEIQKDEQNIKRRVYDALNVLIASKVIEKKGKVVKSCEKSRLNGRCLQADNWKNVKQVESERDKKKEVLKQKQKTLTEYAAKYMALMNLIERNQKTEQDRQNNQYSQQSVDFLNNQDQVQELSQRMNTIKESISLKDKILIDTHDASSNQTQQQQQFLNVPNHTFKFPLILINVPSSSESQKVIVKMSRDQKNGKFFSQSKMIVNSDLDILLQMKMHQVDQKFALKYLDQQLISKYFMDNTFSLPHLQQQQQGAVTTQVEEQHHKIETIDIEKDNSDLYVEQNEQPFLALKNKHSQKNQQNSNIASDYQNDENTNPSTNQAKKARANSKTPTATLKGKQIQSSKNSKKQSKNNLFDANNQIELD